MVAVPNQSIGVGTVAQLLWVLASQSPRRRELLARIVPQFDCISPDVEEWEPPEADPVEQVEHNARIKAQAVLQMRPEALVIAADTTVALHRKLFAKPRDRNHAFTMLSELVGRSHSVFTGVAIMTSAMQCVFHDRSEVRFKPLTAPAIHHYLDVVPVMDKAGAYAIQEGYDLLIDGYTGSFENIMGLPIQLLIHKLQQLNLLTP